MKNGSITIIKKIHKIGIGQTLKDQSGFKSAPNCICKKLVLAVSYELPVYDCIIFLISQERIWYILFSDISIEFLILILSEIQHKKNPKNILTNQMTGKRVDLGMIQ